MQNATTAGSGDNLLLAIVVWVVCNGADAKGCQGRLAAIEGLCVFHTAIFSVRPRIYDVEEEDDEMTLGIRSNDTFEQ